MRLAGLGLIGVVHALEVQDALQRLLGRIDFGVLIQVINTIFFVADGEVSRVYELQFGIQVPSGMVGDVHQQPVILVRNQETGAIEFEVFRYQGETIVIPVKRGEESRPEAPAGARGEERLSRKLLEKENPAGNRQVHRRLRGCPSDQRQQGGRLYRGQGCPGRHREGRKECLGDREQALRRHRYQAEERAREAGIRGGGAGWRVGSGSAPTGSASPSSRPSTAGRSWTCSRARSTFSRRR